MPAQRPAPGTVTMYSTPWCGYCRRLKTSLDREGIAYTDIDIEGSPEDADLVSSLNGGNQTVPTVLFPDGSAATNPTLTEVRRRLTQDSPAASPSAHRPPHPGLAGRLTQHSPPA